MQPSPSRVRTARQVQRGSGSPSTEGRHPPQVQDREVIQKNALAFSEQMKELLKLYPPWTRDVEEARTSHAQSLDGLWMKTSYSLISAYRDRIAKAEHRLQNGQTNGSRNTSDIIKIRSRFHFALEADIVFYRNIIARLVMYYRLLDVAKVALAGVGMGFTNPSPRSQRNEIKVGVEEKKDRLGLVYKALVCLGDLERYRESYKDVTVESEEETEKFAKAIAYYEAARSLVPDDGSAFNQIAVINIYLKDDFAMGYYHWRAMAVKSPFKDTDKILDKFFTRIFEQWWKLQQDEGNEKVQDVLEDNTVDRFKGSFLVIMAILYRKIGLSQLAEITRTALQDLETLLRQRSLPSETIAKLTVMCIASHWHARSTASLNPTEANGEKESDSKRKRRRQVELRALSMTLNIFEVIFKVAMLEAQAAVDALVEEAQSRDLAGPSSPDELHRHISAVLRRILPSLRIISKWMKIHLEYVGRVASTADDDFLDTQRAFWRAYVLMLTSMGKIFPIDRLPSLSTVLEEDIDMLGFLPLSLGSHPSTPLPQPGAEELEHVHPNEEQLMRLSDVQVDARLLSQTSAGKTMDYLQTKTAAALKADPVIPKTPPPAQPPVSMVVSQSEVALPVPVPMPHVIPEDYTNNSLHLIHDHEEIASVSTETEDDPINLAMRVALGDSNEIPHADEHIQPFVEQQVPIPVHTPIKSGTTALDLLQSLVLDSVPRASQHTTGGSHPVSRQSPGQGSPLLFGGDQHNSSIWSMTREESEKGKKRVGQALWNTGSTSAPHLSSQTFATTHTALPYVRNGQPLSVPLPGSGLNPTAASGPMPISVMGLTSGNGTGILPPPRSVWSQETLSSASAWPQYGGTGYYAHLPVSWGQTRDR